MWIPETDQDGTPGRHYSAEEGASGKPAFFYTASGKEREFFTAFFTFHFSHSNAGFFRFLFSFYSIL